LCSPHTPAPRTTAIFSLSTRTQAGTLPTLRFETGPGEQAQVDWGTTLAFFGGERTRIHIFTLVLGYKCPPTLGVSSARE
jgi:transposase